MESLAPNLKLLVGASLGAKLISHAGGLKRLATYPSSTVQIMGAEKALFRHLKSGDRPPKYGLIYQHPQIRGAKWWNRGKIARMLASKISLACRKDIFTKDFDPNIYDEFIENINALELANTADHIYYLSYWKKGSEFMSFTLEPLTQKHIASYLSENFPEIDELYPNWTRHFVRNFLELPDAIFKSWYAHDQQNEIGFSKYSSLQPYTYMIEIQDAVNQLFKRLGLKSVVSQS